MRKLLHARLVAALVHDGCKPEPDVVAVATERLVAIATRKTSGIPFILRRGIWSQDDDCVIAAKALTLIDKDRGLDLLFTLAADPTVPSFSIFDVLAEVMVREDLTEIESARGLKVLYKSDGTEPGWRRARGGQLQPHANSRSDTGSRRGTGDRIAQDTGPGHLDGHDRPHGLHRAACRYR